MGNENLILFLCILSGLVLIILVLIVIHWVSDIFLYYKVRKKIFLSVKNVLHTYFKTMDYQQCIYETNIIFESTIIKNKELHNHYQSPPDLFKACLQVTNEGNCEFEDAMTMDVYKKKLIELIREYEKNNPFEKLEGTDSIVLKELAEMLKGAPKELKGKQLINSLAIQLEKMQNIIYEKDRKMARQDVISIFGIALSILFGIMTFLQFFI